jgi:hypothetical protein
MNFSLVFDQTGDVIPFTPVNQELLEFYLDCLNQQKFNNFFSADQTHGQKILDKINLLHSRIVEINQWLYDLLDKQIEIYNKEEYLSQWVLNKLHADWVNSMSLTYDIQKKRKQVNFSVFAEQLHDMFPDKITHPPLGEVLSKLGLFDLYTSLNRLIHDLEIMFDNIDYTVSRDWVKISDNPFSKNIITNNQANIKISFHHLGRTLHNKFLYFDTNLEHNDENCYNELLGFVTLSLAPAQTIPLSVEYNNWCQQHNKIPSGEFLNIGNIPDLYENVTKYRTIIFRNLLSNNSFSIYKG